MGQQIILSDVAFTDNTLPVLRNDPILSAGSLILVDLGHSLGAVSGIPTSGSTLPNIASDTALALTGSAINAPTLSYNTLVNSEQIAERTSKKGLHVIRSQVGDTASTKFVLTAPAALLTYLLANKAHSYFISIWQEVTRKFTTNGAPNPTITALSATNIGQDKLIAIGANGSINGNTNLIAQSKSLDPTVSTGHSQIQLAVNGSSGTLTAFTFATLFSWGGTLSSGSNGLHVGGSQALYRIYLEDLTVSGRDYPTVKAIDDAMWAAAFAPGGKFYGDTWTDPSVLP